MAKLPDEMYAPIWWTLTPEQQARVEALDEMLSAEYRERLKGLDPSLVNRGILTPLAAELRRSMDIVDRLARATTEEPKMTEEPVLLPARRCWRCRRLTPMLWEERGSWVSCPHCRFYQPPIGQQLTPRLKNRLMLLALDYKRLEGVTVEQQRGG
jgi:hypothetical protein